MEKPLHYANNECNKNMDQIPPEYISNGSALDPCQSQTLLAKDWEEFVESPDTKRETVAEMPRQEWTRGIEFILACIGNAVGLGNLWRFPYLCHSSGGGAFLIPYFIMLFVCGIPLLYLEVAIGQYTRRGPVGALQKLCPFLQGAGMGTVVLSFLFTTYYNVILAWGLYYLGSGFQSPLPWSHCNNSWNRRDLCWDDYSDNASSSRPNNSVSPSQEFYERHILQQSDGIDNSGTVIWQLALILLLAWAMVYLCIWKGIRWTGKVVYFTATFPYLVIFTLLVRGLTLPGSAEGVDFFINPKWELLKDPKVWVYAAAQNFNSIGIAFGSMIAFASYRKREQRIFKDVMAVCLVNSGTSIVAGFAVFSILGHIALNQGQAVEEVLEQGPGLVFIVYPVAFSTMPYGVAQFFSFIFFFMLLCLAIDSQFASVEVIVTTLDDHLGRPLMRYLKRREVLVLIVCVASYLFGLPNITKGGIYFFKLIDYYSSGISNMLIAFCEVVAVGWFFGAKKLSTAVFEMTGTRPYLYFIMCWYVLSPVMIMAIMIFSWWEYEPVTYGKYVFPTWAVGLGWAMAGLSLICLPIGMIKGVWESEGDDILQKFRNSLKPHDVKLTTNTSDDSLPPSYDVAAGQLGVSDWQQANGTHLTKL